jgi:hypothetical protein
MPRDLKILAFHDSEPTTAGVDVIGVAAIRILALMVRLTVGIAPKAGSGLST